MLLFLSVFCQLTTILQIIRILILQISETAQRYTLFNIYPPNLLTLVNTKSDKIKQKHRAARALELRKGQK